MALVPCDACEDGTQVAWEKGVRGWRRKIVDCATCLGTRQMKARFKEPGGFFVSSSKAAHLSMEEIIDRIERHEAGAG